ncbi:unnamed protein product [Pleuronectes platessa]|uniref:Uncharacterized protein n=1 Tax=Pleuronectes platessa TaxID=8262 RepID=A0A9N7YTC0_PLEPL|nr:unnamed protein product [Pleuronectes platessa]
MSSLGESVEGRRLVFDVCAWASVNVAQFQRQSNPFFRQFVEPASLLALATPIPSLCQTVLHNGLVRNLRADDSRAHRKPPECREELKLERREYVRGTIELIASTQLEQEQSKSSRPPAWPTSPQYLHPHCREKDLSSCTVTLTLSDAFTPFLSI